MNRQILLGIVLFLMFLAAREISILFNNYWFMFLFPLQVAIFGFFLIRQGDKLYDSMSYEEKLKAYNKYKEYKGE